MTVRILLCAVAVAIAVYAFTSGIMALAHRDSGYFDIGFTAEGNAVLYQSGLHLRYYAEGSSNEIRRLTNQVQKLYTTLALEAYKLLDERAVYEGLSNIASINAAPNSWVSVPESLYAVLESANSLHSEHYSLFSGALHAQWETLRYLEDPAEFDPANDGDKKALLARHAQWLRTPGTFSLDFDKDNTAVRLNVSDAYLSWAQENGIDAPVLDLNALHDAYLMKAVAQSLRAQGYNDGYLYTDSGLYVYLSGAGQGISFTVNAYDGEKEIAVAALNASSPLSLVRFTAYAPEGAQYGYYTVEKDGKPLYRHLYPDIASGEYCDQLMTLYLAAGENDILDIALRCAEWNGLKTPEEISACAAKLPENTFAAYTLQDGSKTLYIREGNAVKGVTLDPESSFAVQSIEPLTN